MGCITINSPEKFIKKTWYQRLEIWCLIFNLLYGTNSVTTIDWKTFLPYCSHKLITQYIQLRSSQPAFISANYFWRWLYKPFEENWQNELGHDSMSQWLNVSRPCLPHVISRVTWILCIDCIVTREKWWWIIEHIAHCLFQSSIFNSFITREFHQAETQCDSRSRRYNTTLSIPCKRL